MSADRALESVEETRIRVGAADAHRQAENAAANLRRASQIAVALTTLNGLVAATCFGVWVIDGEAALTLARLGGPFGPMFGMLGVGVGAWVHHKQKRGDTGPYHPALPAVSIFVGMIAMSVFVLIPMSAAIESMLMPSR